MTFEEAIKKVAEVLDVTENEEVFEALKGNSGEWEEKYNELKKKYTERFIDEITKPEEKKEEKEEKEEIKIEDLDFDGSTE